MSSYEIMEGNRKGSHVYFSGSYLYTKEKERYRYFKWVEYRKGCPGRALIDLETDQLTITKAHNDHNQITDEKVEVLKLKTTLKRKAETSQGTLRQTFDDEANSSMVGGQVSFVNLESSMYKRRKPNVPHDAEDAITLLDDCNDQYKRYLAFIINEPETENLHWVP